MALPSGYKVLSYLESTGRQYIDPEIYLGNQYYIEVEASINTAQYNVQGLYGAYTDVDANKCFCGLYYGELRVRLGSATLTRPADDQFHSYYTEPGKVWIDSYNTMGSTTFGVSGDLHLFMGYSNTSSGGIGVYPSYAKVKSFTIRDQQMNIYAKLMPALRTADKKPGLYDIVRNKFFVNKGGGEFLYEIEDTSSIRVKVNGSWKTGTPYIKVNGEWKKGTAYIKTNGSWKKGV